MKRGGPGKGGSGPPNPPLRTRLCPVWVTVDVVYWLCTGCVSETHK